MRRVLALLLVALVALPGVALAGTIGLGAFGGITIPVVQDDAEQGSVFGLRAPVSLVPLLTVEPYFAKSGLGDTKSTIAGIPYTLDGLDLQSFGANVMLTMGGPISFYPFLGISSNSVKRGSGDSQSFTGYQGGLGLAMSPVPKLSVHLRGELQAIVDGSTSRKFGNVTLGASYSLFSMP
jgi:opacity protein-like surface antigen